MTDSPFGPDKPVIAQCDKCGQQYWFVSRKSNLVHDSPPKDAPLGSKQKCRGRIILLAIAEDE